MGAYNIRLNWISEKGVIFMTGKRKHNIEAITRKLRQAEIKIHEGKFIAETSNALGISDAT